MWISGLIGRIYIHVKEIYFTSCDHRNTKEWAKGEELKTEISNCFTDHRDILISNPQISLPPFIRNMNQKYAK